MKKSWKKLLCSLMLAPCMFVATACGDDPEDPKNLTTDLTIEQQQEAYATLRTVAAAALNNDGTKDQAYALKYSRENREVVDLDNAGLTAENKAAVYDPSRMNRTNTITKTVYGGYKTNNTGYKIDTYKVFNSELSDVVAETASDIVKYNGQYYELYQKNNNNKSLYRVNNVYAKNSFVVGPEDLLEGGDYQDLYFLFQYAKDTTTFDTFKNVLVDVSAETIAETKIQNPENVDFTNYISTQYAFSVTNDVYTLKVDVAVDATNAAVVYLEDGVLTGNGSVEISFDNNSIKKLSFDYSSVMTVRRSPASMFEGRVNQEFTADDVVVQTNTSSVKLGIDFTTGFDDNYYNQSLTDYTGTGNNGEIKTVEVQANLSLANANLEVSYISAKFNYNESLLSAIENELSYILSRNNLFIQSCYLVFDEKLEKITETTLVPSTEFSVYVELTEEVKEFVETLVTVHYEDGTYETLSMYTNNNLYGEIKAVFGLTDDQIAGIYSDAELENLLDSSTLITENMTVYLVLNENVSSND